MNKNIWIVVVVLVVLVVGGFYLFSGNEDVATVTEGEPSATVMAEEDKVDVVVMDDKSVETKSPGSYVAYSPEKVLLASADRDVVMFFRASWCPTCRALDADIKANLSAIPSSLAILDVDYDNSTDLKKKYEVTYQHTFVQVDKDGNLIKKWTGTPTLTALVAEVK